MKRFSLLCILLCTLLPAGIAHAQENITVRLNDGAAIPYFEDLESTKIVRNTSDITGITGAAQGAIRIDYIEEYDIAGHTLTLQNVSMTEDFIAVFYLMERDSAFVFTDGKSQPRIDRIAWATFSLADAEGCRIEMNDYSYEARLLDDQTALCASIYSLREPLKAGTILRLYSIYAEWEEGDRISDGQPHFALSFDRSNALDYSKAFVPAQEFAMKDAHYEWDGETTIRVERVTFSPFGNRLLIQGKDIGKGAAPSFALMDDQGNYLMNFCLTGHASSSIASPEHPQWVYNEYAFFGGENSVALYLVPMEGGTANRFEHSEVFVPLSQVPGSFALPEGGTIFVDAAHVDEEGYSITLHSDTPYTMFAEPAGANGERLGLNYGSGASISYAKQTYTATDTWIKEYKDSMVSMITEQERAQIRGFIVHYDASPALDIENRVEVPLH